MTDVTVILNVEAVQGSVGLDNIVMGNCSRDNKDVVIGSIVSLDDVTTGETTDDQRDDADEVAESTKKETINSNFDVVEGKNLNNANVNGNVRRKRHRRGKSKKRKWKPYNKLTWDEKRQLEDRESLRAHRVRAERFAHGQAVAPYNTTQFLMEDHNELGPTICDTPNDRPRTCEPEHQRQRRESGMEIDSDIYYSSPEDEEEFLQKEFSQVYQNVHAERLSSMTKMELIHEYMLLEDRVEMLEQRIKDESGTVEMQTKQLHRQIQSLEDEIRKMKDKSGATVKLNTSEVLSQVSRSESSSVDENVCEEVENAKQLGNVLAEVDANERYSDNIIMDEDKEEKPVSDEVSGESEKSDNVEVAVDQIIVDSSKEREEDSENDDGVKCQQAKETVTT